jgi:hypothetical protein
MEVVSGGIGHRLSSSDGGGLARSLGRETAGGHKKTSCGDAEGLMPELLAASPIVPVSGLAVPPYRQRQVGGRVIGPVPSTPLSIE